MLSTLGLLLKKSVADVETASILSCLWLLIDNTLHAKQLVTCLQHMQSLKEKVSVDELAGTYIGSKAALIKNQKFDQISAYGKGKGHFKSISHLTGFIYYLIINGIFVEHLRDEQDRVKSTFVTLGNIRELLGGLITVLY